jgi:prolyl 4-hydroxylase
MQFIGDYTIDGAICERLVELHRVCDHKGLVRRGAIGRAEARVVDLDKKDSFDLTVSTIPDDLHAQYGVPAYYAALQGCLERYLAAHPILARVGRFGVTESPTIQHYRPGGGFRMEHFERTGHATATRMLVWMTFLNDVDGGGTRFVYQDTTIDARRGRTLIWPTDFTHTHAGVVSPTAHKYIITGWMNYFPPS